MKSIVLFFSNAVFAQFYDSSPLVKMADYDKNYRTLSCWECFEAQGKMCHADDYTSMIRVTGSSNIGHGVCCKPDYTGDHCNSDADHECSQPAKITDANSPLKDILRTGDLNYKMFAYCPGTNQKICGISDDTTSHDMTLYAS